MIVIDCGSTDSTTLVAKIGGAKVIAMTNKNRGEQLHTGAMSANGNWLFFLHADSRLKYNWKSKIINLISNPLSKQYAWYFNFKTEKKGFIWFILELAVYIRSNLFNSPYGDQGLLLSKELYSRIGGYKEIPIMEDLDLITRLKQITTLRSLGSGIETNSRKYLGSNIIKNAIKNALLRYQWRKGANINELAKRYYAEN
ncbi:Glycosyltransferase [Prochlorococcus marinus str. SS51]|nr:Glycosyltransferase [Prochlorococcus marinus str. SS35]KGG33908.1 Glycosyltransferase [Prochlorococcus marinus str. SS51]